MHSKSEKVLGCHKKNKNKTKIRCKITVTQTPKPYYGELSLLQPYRQQLTTIYKAIYIYIKEYTLKHTNYSINN